MKAQTWVFAPSKKQQMQTNFRIMAFVNGYSMSTGKPARKPLGFGRTISGKRFLFNLSKGVIKRF